MRARTRILAFVVFALGGVAAANGLAAVQQSGASHANPIGAGLDKLPPSYLKPDQLPDSLALLPPPPAPGSAAMKRDEAAWRSVRHLRGTPRYRLAASDAVIAFPNLPDDFSCAAGFPISEQRTPKLYRLMAKMTLDVGLATYKAKNHYERVRPFVVHKTATCYPKDDAALRHDGSYPSGHSAIGWGYALVLAELIPSRTDTILERGRDFGQSRLVCGAHWQSDIDAGRMIGAAAVARLHSDAAFRADLDSVRQEIATAPEFAPEGAGQCRAESAALSER